MRKEIQELKEAIKPKSPFDFSCAREEFLIRMSEMSERICQRGELPTLSAEENEAIKEILTKVFRERVEELKKNPWFQRYIRGV